MTTIEDLYLWDLNFYDAKLGDSGFVDQMLTCGKLNSGEQLQYAFGLAPGKYRSLETISHDGGLFGFRTEMIRFPEQRFTVICLCNLGNMNPWRLATQIAAIYLANEFELEEFAGDYYSNELQVTYKMVAEGSNLLVKHPNAPEDPLECAERCDLCDC